jgi:hypothetical protein
MKHGGVCLGILCFLVFAASGEAVAEGGVRVRLQIFRTVGDMYLEETSLRENIWAESREDWERVKKSVTLFDHGHLRLGDNRLEINERGCYWNRSQLTFREGDRVKLPEDRIRLIHSPSVRMETRKYSTVKIESKQLFEYFERREDGLCEPKRMELPTGLTIGIRPQIEKDDWILFKEMKITLRSVGKREKIPGLELQVGRPILETQQYVLGLRVRPRRNYGILLRPGDGHGAIFIRLFADLDRD